MKTDEIKAWARTTGALVDVATPEDHNAQAQVERPIRTLTEASRAILTHGNGDNIKLWPVGVLSAMRALCLLPTKKLMVVRPRKGDKQIARPPTPHEGWSGRSYDSYKAQWGTIVTPLCEAMMFLSKQKRGSKTENPGVPCIVLGPAYDNSLELNAHLVARYSDGKRMRAQYIFANEDRLPLKDGASPGLVMHPSILALQNTAARSAGIRNTLPMSHLRSVEPRGDMATAQDLQRDTRLTAIVDEEDEEKAIEQSDQPGEDLGVDPAPLVELEETQGGESDNIDGKEGDSEPDLATPPHEQDPDMTSMPSLEDVARTDLLRVELPYHVKDRGRQSCQSKQERRLKRRSECRSLWR